jgi:hypothetical protein
VFDCLLTLCYIYYMTNEEAYNHGYNCTLTLSELMALFPPCGLRDEEPSQFSAWRSGRQDAAYDEQDDFSDSINEDAIREDRMTDAEADADTLASAGWGTDEDYGGDSEWI